MSTGDLAISVEDVSKKFRVYHSRNLTLKGALLNRGRGRYEQFWALKDVSLELRAGRTLGVIGENGSGKSTLLKVIAKILLPDRGRVRANGRLAALLELGAGFHVDYSGRENIYLNGALLGLPRSYIDSVLDEIIEFSGLERFIDSPVKTYSSGMYARLGFSIAVHLDPDILVVDEILAVGDEAFQRRCFARIAQLKSDGRTLVIVSHALASIRELCTDCAWLDRGELREMGPASTVVAHYIADVNERESEAMRAEIKHVHEIVPSGRAGVGVTRVTFKSGGRPAQVFATGEPFEVEVEYHAPAPLQGARFTVGFVREDGILAFSTSTDDEEMVTLPPSGVVTLTVDSLPLLDGLFRTSVAITEVATEEPYTLLETAFPFRVQNPEQRDSGVVRPDYSWRLPAERARTSSR